MRCSKIYSITLSARATNVAGTVMPSALAVLRVTLRLRAAGWEEVRSAVSAVAGVRDIVAAQGGEAGDTEPAAYLIAAERRPALAAEIVAALVGRGIAVSGLTEAAPDLERIFLDLTRRPVKAAA